MVFRSPSPSYTVWRGRKESEVSLERDEDRWEYYVLDEFTLGLVELFRDVFSLY